jgi:20S proteasome alpha/beta subunit
LILPPWREKSPFATTAIFGNNILDSQGGFMHPDRKKKRKNPVTIIVGIISETEIVLASDSQTTYGTAKRSDVEKISVVEFSNATALVAESGAAQLSGKVVEILQEKAKGKELTDYRMVAELTQESLREVRNSLVKLNEGCNFSEDKWERYFRDENPVELMVAHYFGDKPYIYTVDLFTCTANKAKLHYEAIGCGSNLGGYLLSELSYPKMDSELATAIAVHVVESVKKHDAYCGGATKVAILRKPQKPQIEGNTVYAYPPPGASPGLDKVIATFGLYPLPACRVFSKDEVERLVEIVTGMDNKTKKQRHKIIQKALLREATNYFKSLDTFRAVKKRRAAMVQKTKEKK